MTEDLSRAERALRAMLTDRATAAPEAPGLFGAVRRRHRRRRAALVAGTAVVAAVAVSVPALALGRGEPAPVAATPTPVVTAKPGSCPGGPGADAPGLPAQGTVPGALGADPAAVTAVLRVGWGLLRQQAVEGGLEAGTAEVRLVDRTSDGVVVGLVTAGGSGSRLGSWVVVTGSRLDRLSAEQAQGVASATVLIAQPRACGRPQVVVWAPPGTTATTSAFVGVRADATAQTEVRPVPVRPDGVAVFARPSTPGAALTVTPSDGTQALRYAVGPDLVAPPCVPVAPPGRGCTTVAQAVAAAPGDGDPAQAVSALGRLPALPVTPSDLRVLWRGRAAGGTVTAALVTLPSGAGYVWGGVVSRRMSGTFSYSGLLRADQLDRVALVVQLPDAPLERAVFVPGTGRLRATVGGVPRSVTIKGGAVLTGGPVTDLSVTAEDGTFLPIVRIESLAGLPRAGG